MLADEDKKFIPKITVPYSPSLFFRAMPIVKIEFQNLPQPIPALIDSGATNSMLHPAVATSIGLKVDYNTVKMGTGAGGGFKYTPGKPVETGLLGQKFMISFDIVLDDNFAWPCILGHDSIFKYAKVVFKSYKNEFDIFFRKDIS